MLREIYWIVAALNSILSQLAKRYCSNVLLHQPILRLVRSFMIDFKLRIARGGPLQFRLGVVLI